MVAKSCKNNLHKYRSILQLKTLTTFICKRSFLFTEQVIVYDIISSV